MFGSRSSGSTTQKWLKYGLIFLFVGYLVLGLLYDVTVPLFEKPDELKHFALIQYIQTQRGLPVVEAGIYRPWDQEGTQPPFYHLLAAFVTAWLDLSNFEEPVRNPHYVDDRSFVWRERGNNNLYLHPPGEIWQENPVLVAARLARWLSLLAGLVTLYLTYRLAQVVFETGIGPDPPYNSGKSETTGLTNRDAASLIAAALAAFVPQFLHVNSAITNDSLSVSIAAAVLFLLALIIRNGSSNRYALLLGIGLGLGAIAKLSLLYLVPLSGMALVIDGWRHRAWPRFVRHGLIIGVIMLSLAGWWYWRNWSLYGDITALNAHLLYRGGALDPRPSLAQIWRSELVGLELSFWAAFGAGQILLEPWLYDLLRWLKYIIFIGLILGFWRYVRPKQPTPSQFTIIILLLTWSIINLGALLRWMQITPASWGRLLFPSLPALAILAVWSLSQFHQLPHRFSFMLCARGRPLFALRLPLLLAALLFTLSLVSPFRYLQAAYAKTSLIAEADIPFETITEVDLTYDGGLRLIGYSVDKSSLRAGEWLPVTLYWQAIQPLTKNYSGFVHLLDSQGQSLGQANTYPDGGKWPTSMLPVGQILPDTYYVFIPPSTDAKAPLMTRLAFGIFEFEDPLRMAKPAVNANNEIVEPIVEGIPLLPHRWPRPHPEVAFDVNFGGQIKLIGYDRVNQSWEPGTQTPLTFYWETLAPPGKNLNLFIHLIDLHSQTQIAGFDAPPSYPTAFWQTGNTIIDSRTLSFPPDLPPGDYELRVGWYDLDTFVRLPTPAGDSLALLTFAVEP